MPAAVTRSVIRRFGIAPDPVFQRFFFFVFVRVVHFCVKPSQLHDFVQGARDHNRAALVTRIFSAIDFEPIRHKSLLLYGNYNGPENFKPVKTYHQFIYRYTSR
jgi:hypothetical protein